MEVSAILVDNGEVGYRAFLGVVLGDEICSQFWLDIIDGWLQYDSPLCLGVKVAFGFCYLELTFRVCVPNRFGDKLSAAIESLLSSCFRVCYVLQHNLLGPGVGV